MKLKMISGTKEVATQDIKIVKTMSSIEIAQLTEKNHKDVMRDIRNIEAELGQRISAPSSYVSEQNKKITMLTLDKENSLLLVSGYSVKLRQKIIRRWLELEGNLARNLQEAIQLVEATVDLNGSRWGKAGADQKKNRKVVKKFNELVKSELIQELNLF